MARLKTDEKLEEILEAASQVFAEKDFHHVLIDEIAEVGGIGKGTVYRYFRTKEDLYYATILRGLDRLHTLLSAALPQEARPHAAPGADRARNALLLLAPAFAADAALPRRASPFRPAGAVCGSATTGSCGLVQEALVEGIERREFRGVDPFIGAEIFLGMIRGINIFRRDGDTIDELVAEIVGVFTRGVERA